MYVCVHACNCVWCLCVRCVCVCSCLCVCVHVCTCGCVHKCMCACVHVCMCACVHVCMRACDCSCGCVCLSLKTSPLSHLNPPLSDTPSPSLIPVLRHICCPLPFIQCQIVQRYPTPLTDAPFLHRYDRDLVLLHGHSGMWCDPPHLGGHGSWGA